MERDDQTTGVMEERLQTVAFYRFEREARRRYEPRRRSALSLPACADLVEAACEQVGRPLPHPLVLTGARDRYRGTLVRHAEPGGEVWFHMMLPTSRRRPWAVLHETAHMFMWADAHGPWFAEGTLLLWAGVGGWPIGELRALAAECGVATAEGFDGERKASGS
jgi:hypothetical protein